MITPMTIWLCVAGGVLGLIALRLVNIAAKNGFFRHPVFDTGTEREEIWHVCCVAEPPAYALKKTCSGWPNAGI